MSQRYTAHGVQGTSQSGPEGDVPPNRLGLKDLDDLAEAELRLLQLLYEAVLVEALPDRTLVVDDLFTWHRRRLGNVYDWAGLLRTVNLSKGGFMFANAQLIPRLLEAFEVNYPARYKPARGMDRGTVIHGIAVTHVEIILIHPFREGNGRLSRLLADVMAVQSGREPLDYSGWDADKESYFGAIRSGQGNDYGPMERFVAAALRD